MNLTATARTIAFDPSAASPSAAHAGAAQEAASLDRLANKEVFLQLLVAQIRHQNPLKPAEGTEFVAQLAQFTQLELTLGMRKDLAEIRESLSAASHVKAEPAPAEDGTNPD
ncbi:MAG: flagellar hook capping FlgD N-terminal domain-containing protein [Bryobacteraceae bacterium]